MTPIQPSDAQVLVIEDSVPSFVLIARMLGLMGVARCELKTSGWQADGFGNELPDINLILMDINLPYEDGYKALQRLRRNKRLKDTLVVAITADSGEEQMAKARSAGFNGFLGKPLDADRFPGQIERILSGQEVWEWN